MQKSSNASEKQFDCFLSYSTDPDYKLVAKVENFLESFHKNFNERQRKELGIHPLQVCVDESDLDFNSLEEGADARHPITQAIERGLGMSNWLIVFCSKNAMESKWVHDEIQWWEDNSDTSRIKLVLTDPEEPVEDLFSSQIDRLKLTEKPWIDLRGWGTRKSEDEKIRDSHEQLVQLASLLQSPSKTKGELWPSWKRESDRRKRRRIFVGVTALILSIAGLIVINWQSGQNQVKEAEIQLRKEQTRAKMVVKNVFWAELSYEPFRLVIHYPPSSPELDWREFSDSVAKLPSMSSFRVVDCQFETLDFLSAHEQLKELGLNNCSKIKNFGALNKLKSLTILDLSETGISDIDASEIIWPKHLKKMSFHRCNKLTSSGVSTILERCQEVTNLVLSAQHITPKVSLQIIGSQIEELTIDGTLDQDLLSTLKQHTKVETTGVSKPSGTLQ